MANNTLSANESDLAAIRSFKNTAGHIHSQFVNSAKVLILRKVSQHPHLHVKTRDIYVSWQLERSQVFLCAN
ncbi:hypothetical protein F7725_022352 [Dissostichus mawsoni]|uniref:Uncharacterized protein n=1 Tax=Dissostichus mawsoni TaxID=36200 RepID=A0A7J5Z0J5_DISMA|nr:hypothetical protein F7725_022352 [Dissostichus mawsoni]